MLRRGAPLEDSKWWAGSMATSKNCRCSPATNSFPRRPIPRGRAASRTMRMKRAAGCGVDCEHGSAGSNGRAAAGAVAAALGKEAPRHGSRYRAGLPVSHGLQRNEEATARSLRRNPAPVTDPPGTRTPPRAVRTRAVCVPSHARTTGREIRRMAKQGHAENPGKRGIACRPPGGRWAIQSLFAGRTVAWGSPGPPGQDAGAVVTAPGDTTLSER
jgi:hypothetical protein